MFIPNRQKHKHMSRLYLGLTFILLFLTFNQKVKAEEIDPELQEVLLRLGSKKTSERKTAIMYLTNYQHTVLE